MGILSDPTRRIGSPGKPGDGVVWVAKNLRKIQETLRFASPTKRIGSRMSFVFLLEMENIHNLPKIHSL